MNSAYPSFDCVFRCVCSIDKYVCIKMPFPDVRVVVLIYFFSVSSTVTMRTCNCVSAMSTFVRNRPDHSHAPPLPALNPSCNHAIELYSATCSPPPRTTPPRASHSTTFIDRVPIIIIYLAPSFSSSLALSLNKDKEPSFEEPLGVVGCGYVDGFWV